MQLNLQKTRILDVVGFGTNAVDYLITVPKYPEYDSKTRLISNIRAAGGEVASTLSGLSRLGMSTRYIGRFGDDQEGVFGLQSLRDDGVDVSLSQTITGAATQIAFIIIDQGTGERTVIWERDDKLSFSADDVPSEQVSKSKIFHCTPHDTSACRKLALEARDAGTLVSMDLDAPFEGLQDLLPLVDILVTSSDFPSKFLGISDQHQALKEMKEKFGCVITGITRGRTGSLMFVEDRFIESPGYSVPGGCKDTTGAGDAFRAGLLFGVLNELPIEDVGKVANAVAALKCREVGARTALPRIAEIEELTGLRFK